MTAENKEMVTITKGKYEVLKERDFWLSCLENAGVDNWSGYGYAYELYKEYSNEDED